MKPVGGKYADEVAVIAKRGTAEKKDLKHSPFVIELKYGANNESYWSYKHMVLHLEDCVDFVKVVAPQFVHQEVDGYLGPYPKVLKPGDVQSMVFKEIDAGPFWLTMQKRIEQ
jgi:hypothetical protein